MGLCDAPATFQTLLDGVFCDFIGRFVVVYVDEISICSRTQEELLEHIHTVLFQLRQHQLYVFTKKCSFMATKTEFSGLWVRQEGCSTIGGDQRTGAREWQGEDQVPGVHWHVSVLDT